MSDTRAPNANTAPSVHHTDVPKQHVVNDPQSSDALNPPTSEHKAKGATTHVAWFDYAKGICIILVVMMHSTLGVGEAFAEHGLEATGFMHHIVAFAKPFRMPDFFLLAGLFLSLAIGRGWLHYLDKKLLHFAYFYVLWTVIQAIIKTAATTGSLDAAGLLGQFQNALINPYPTLWFIYVLPLFFIVTKLMRTVPAWLFLSGAALLQIMPAHTGWSAIDHFAVHYYVFFLAGYLLAPHIFAVADWAKDNTALALTGIASWALFNTAMAFTPSPLIGWATYAQLPVISIMMGAMGALAIVVIASQLSKFNVAPFIRYCGQNSIVIYISFAIPMAMTRVILLKTNFITDVGVASFIVWLVALITPLVLYALVRNSALAFLYQRPAWLALPYRKQARQTNTIDPGVPAPIPV